jgi:two-component system LytT family sensor kinase
MTPATNNSSRAYWVCQGAGWSGFAAYIAAAYIAFAPHWNGTVAAAIVLFDSVVCLSATHLLRRWMQQHQWLILPWRRLVPRLVLAVLLLALALTAMVIALDLALDRRFDLRVSGASWTLVAFVGAVGGWVLIYIVVHGRRRHERAELEMKVLVREAQLDSLRAQVNPHFLFNCLNSVRALILQDPERAVAMITTLGDLLRYALASDKRRVVPLAEELAVVDEYLDLERMRFEERLQVDRRIDTQVLRLTVPPMLVHTLVENAIKHGVSRHPGGGVVGIDAEAVGSMLSIRVTSTGRLLDDDGDGFGLQSVRERLRLLYGDAAALTLTEAGDTTVAALQLPVE